MCRKCQKMDMEIRNEKANLKKYAFFVAKEFERWGYVSDAKKAELEAIKARIANSQHMFDSFQCPDNNP